MENGKLEELAKELYINTRNKMGFINGPKWEDLSDYTKENYYYYIKKE